MNSEVQEILCLITKRNNVEILQVQSDLAEIKGR